MAESITRKNIDLDILDYYDGKIKNYVDDKVGTGSLTIDDTLSDTSTNPVQNKVVMSALAEKALKSKYGDTTIDVGRKLNTTVGTYSTAEGYQTTASGAASHAEGCETTASKMGSHAEGRETTASGQYSHSEGYSTTASGLNSHAEGETTTASGDYSHAEGYYTTAIGDSSHAEGRETTASKNNSHAEGTGTTASGYASHAEGQSTTASGDYSHAGGHHTQALKEAEFAHGQYNQSNDNTLFSIGDGTADDARHNAFEITTTGGKLHDKDIATTDLIPTSFAQNAVLSTIEQVNDPNLESGIYSAENVSMSFSSGVESSWFMMVVNKHRTIAGYGTQIAIPYDNGEQRGTFYRICHAGNWGNWIRIADENIITNENLLLNPDFRINQQGKSVYTGTTECWDKWTINAGWETARSNDDLAAIFTCVTPQVNSWVVSQNIPNYKDYRGKTVTFSANIVTASTKFSLLINDGVNQLSTPVTTGRYSVTYTVSDNATELWCVICTDGQESKNEQIAVLSTKLELGTIATTFVPPNPSIEIAKVRAVNDDFVNAADRDQIQIPSNVDVPVWIHTNGKRFQRYMTNGGNIGLTNVPDNSTDYVWYWYDGMNIIARAFAVGKYYICDMINGVFSGWKDIYTSGYKPYVTGTVTITDTKTTITTNHGFIPSAVFWWKNSSHSDLIRDYALNSAIEFTDSTITIDYRETSPSSGTNWTLYYIIFK